MEKENEVYLSTQKRLKQSTIYDIEIVHHMAQKAIYESTRPYISEANMNYYLTYADWCKNLEGSILDCLNLNMNIESIEDIRKIRDIIGKMTFTENIIHDIQYMRANNSFYKKVLAEYFKKEGKMEELLDVLDENALDEEDVENVLNEIITTEGNFIMPSVKINSKEIKSKIDFITEYVKRESQNHSRPIRLNITRKELASYENLPQEKRLFAYIDDYIRTIADSKVPLVVKKTSDEVFDIIYPLYKKLEELKEDSIIDEKSQNYYTKILYCIYEYYESVSTGQQLVLEENLKGKDLGKNQFILNQMIAEAVYKANHHDYIDTMDENPKQYTKNWRG